MPYTGGMMTTSTASQPLPGFVGLPYDPARDRPGCWPFVGLPNDRPTTLQEDEHGR